MRCNIVIYGDEQTQEFSCVGELFLFEKDFSLSYMFGLDNCFLTYDGQLLRHKKTGDIPVEIEFVPNKRTLCRIGSGEFSGKISVFTNSLEVQICDNRISIDVVYELDGENKQMKISADVLN